MNRTVVLVGAGHAHLHVVSNARAFTTRGVRMVLVDPGIFWYSGLATGMLSGQYDPADDQIDVADLALRFGAEFIPGKVSSISREHKRVVLEGGLGRLDLPAQEERPEAPCRPTGDGS